MSMDNPTIGRFEPASLDYANRSEYHDSHEEINLQWPLYRPAASWRTGSSIRLHFYPDEGFVCVNGEKNTFDPMLLGPGEWWCYILRNDDGGNLETSTASYNPDNLPTPS